MNNSHSESYRDAGVDVTAGYRAVELMKQHIARTVTSGVLGGIGGFGGMFELDASGMERPVLVSGTDGVGTKLRLAHAANRHDTIGIDCVAMCVNDVICCGAKPLFFLDYIACGKNKPERIAEIVSGVAEGCVQSGCALVGGETAEMPGFYAADEYDIAGFCVGVVDKAKIIDGSRIEDGDLIVGLDSTGPHSNGYSLIRRIFDVEHRNLDIYVERLGDTLLNALLTPTRIYVKAVEVMRAAADVRALCHITGGGFYENVPRMLPEGKVAVIEKERLHTLPVFDLIQSDGRIPERDMYNTFNMGTGMCAVFAPVDAECAIRALDAAGYPARVIGRIENGERGVVLTGQGRAV